MAYEYVSDMFGELRGGRETRYTPIEKRAKEWMIALVENRRYGIDFVNEFRDILREFNALIDEIGHFDEDTPLWLNTIGGFHFHRWYQYQQIYWYYRDHIDHLTEAQWKDYDRLMELDIDERFREVCETCLTELYKVQHPEGVMAKEDIPGVDEMSGLIE